MMRPLASPLAAVAFAAAATFFATPAAPSSVGHFSLSGARVHVYNLAGSVSIVAGTGTSVTVESTMGGRDEGQVAVQTMPGAEPALIFKYPGKKIVYRPDSKRFGTFSTNLDVGADGRFGDGWGKDGIGLGKRRVEIRSSGDGLEAWADLKVAIPPGQRAAIHLGVGGVTVENVDGELLVDCAAAGVSTQATKGRLRIDTGSGGVDVHGAAGDVRIDTGSGAVSVMDFSGPSLVVDTGSGAVKMATVTATSKLSVDTGSGKVEMVGVRAPHVSVDTGSGSVFLGLAATVEDLAVDTGSGSVTVEAPANLDASVRLETGSGGLEVDFPMRLSSRDDDLITGTIGEGRGKIVLETGSGRIRLVKV